MAGRRRATITEDLAEVRGRIEHWRKTREKRTRMPEELWSLAVGLAEKHGVYATSSALKINYDTLNTRLSNSNANKSRVSERHAAFVELDSSQLFGPFGRNAAEVEILREDGARLIIRLRQDESVDVAGIVAAFWRRDA